MIHEFMFPETLSVCLGCSLFIIYKHYRECNIKLIHYDIRFKRNIIDNNIMLYIYHYDNHITCILYYFRHQKHQDFNVFVFTINRLENIFLLLMLSLFHQNVFAWYLF